ncbi:MAG: hypothetical protein D6694_07960 [Gammaproteobacteria bacterium]|nr:MAG: hypothetical protein D6694_07960 [Gammaproteobacteria bacterium]
MDLRCPVVSLDGPSDIRSSASLFGNTPFWVPPDRPPTDTLDVGSILQMLEAMSEQFVSLDGI